MSTGESLVGVKRTHIDDSATPRNITPKVLPRSVADELRPLMISI